jgi:hypothetical protein
MTMTDTVNESRPLSEAERAGQAARLARCGVCWAEPGEPCGDARGGLDGVHLARYARARRRGLLGEAAMTAALAAAGDVFTDATIVPDGAR